MAFITWSIRRYELSNFDKKACVSVVRDWLEQRECRWNKFDKLYKKRWHLSFAIAPPGQRAWKQTLVALSIYYIPPILYLATTDRLPEECSDILDNLLVPWVLNKGGKVIDNSSLLFEGDKWKHPPDYCNVSNKPKYANDKSHQPVVQPSIRIHLNDDLEEISTASETVFVPQGVEITVTRSRTIEHTVDVARI
ncbi:MAG: hypothetical protein QNJ55_13555 [Xenococcus sp. MO_188.B8]|nr:hypothetical protein [Xenococcus sp. MO_188.B8]